MPLRQEVFNVVLAQLLEQRGLVTAPEQILKGPTLRSVKLPDVIVDLRGLRLIIEAEFGTAPAYEDAAYNKARQRVDEGIAHIGIAVLYPARLRPVGFTRLKARLAEASLRFAILTEATVDQAPPLPPLAPPKAKPAFIKGTLDDLADALRRCYEQLVDDNVLKRAVEILEGSIETFTNALESQPAATERFAKALGIGDSLSPKQRDATNRIASLILLNAMIFQEILAQKDGRVSPLQQFRHLDDLVTALGDHWRFILDEINYHPIFHIARELVSSLASSQEASRAGKNMIDAALQIVGWRAALRHDLAGRIYHSLLTEAKYLGAYYTSIPAAALLLKLALRSDAWPQDWADTKALCAFRIADLACGTGTLLAAAAEAIVDNYLRASVEIAGVLDLDGLHRTLVGEVVWGFDVLQSAVHLTASTLALRVPDTPINVTHLSSIPLGGPDGRLGSLEFLEDSTVIGSLDAPQPDVVVGRKGLEHAGVFLPKLDLCVMNPPFTRSVGGNLLFGNVPEDERGQLQRRLKRLVSKHKLSASITAGLGSVFVALADRYLKPGGRLALVLPRALLSGVAWGRTRNLIAQHYCLEFLIVSHEANHWNFSENTNLSEVLIVARKRTAPADDERVVCLNLWRQPANAVEALSVARSLLEGRPPDAQIGQGALEVAIGTRKLGEAVSIPWPAIRDELWGLPCAFAQVELVRAACHLRKGNLYLPRAGPSGRLPLCSLGQLGGLGFDCRDMHDGFQPAPGRATTAFPAFWSHDTAQVTTMQQEPNRFLQPLPQAKPGRPLRQATHLWTKAGRVLFAERMRLNTVRLFAVLTTEKVLSNVWWTFTSTDTDADTDDAEKALVLWLNSTPGLLLVLAHREETEGAWVKFKKPVLEGMPVLDVRKIRTRRRAKLAYAYDKLAQRGLKSLPNLETDEVRASIDEAVADALELPDFSILRELLAREPIICCSNDRLMPGGEAYRG